MEPVRNAIAIAIEEETHVALARRAAAEYVRRLGLSDDLLARAELVAVELAGNIFRHAGRGRMVLTPLPSGCGMHLLALDAGPGLGDVGRAMTDGYSTGGTPGLGLGAVSRLVTGMDVYSWRGAGGAASAGSSAGAATGTGTVIAATLRETSSRPRSAFEAQTELREDLATAVVSIPIAGETLNGDSWAVYTPAFSASATPGPALKSGPWSESVRTVYLMVDGLGHGAFAAEASLAAVRAANSHFATDPTIPLTTLVERLNLPLRATRGAAVMLVSVMERTDGSLDLLGCGVGNISSVVVSPEGSSKTLVSHNGTVGHRMPRVQEFPMTVSAGSLLVMHSDGISTRWKMSSYPRLAERSPAAIGGVLLRDFARDRDDATVLVSRLGGGVRSEEARHG